MPVLSNITHHGNGATFPGPILGELQNRRDLARRERFAFREADDRRSPTNRRERLLRRGRRLISGTVLEAQLVDAEILLIDTHRELIDPAT